MKNAMNPLLDKLSLPMDIAGRVLLGAYFLVPGVTKVVGFAGTLAYMELHGVPFTLPLLLLTIPLQVGGGLALIANWNARTAAFLLAGLTLLINVFMHDFWNDYPGMSCRTSSRISESLRDYFSLQHGDRSSKICAQETKISFV